MTIIKKNTNNKYCQGWEKREPSDTMGRNVECGKECGGFSKKQKYDHMTQQFHSWVYIRKKKTQIQKDARTSILTAVSFTIVKIWKQYTVHRILQVRILE